MATDRNAGAHEAGAGAPRPTETDLAGTTPAVAGHPPEVTREPSVDVTLPDRRQDAVRWGAVWAGLIAALATFILVELIFFAFGWLTLAQGSPDTTAGWITGLIGLFAFLVGGMIAGGTSIWYGVREGAVHGVLVWALGVVSIIFVTLFGGGALFGSVAGALTDVVSLQQANLPDVQAAEAVDTARSGAGWAVLGLVLALVASVVGGIAGVKTGSRKDKDTSKVEVH